jgi:hypothetical protein
MMKMIRSFFFAAIIAIIDVNLPQCYFAFATMVDPPENARIVGRIELY